MTGEILQLSSSEVKCNVLNTSLSTYGDVSDQDKENCDVNFQSSQTEGFPIKRGHQQRIIAFSEELFAKDEEGRKQQGTTGEEHNYVQLRIPERQTNLDSEQVISAEDHRNSLYSERQNKLLSPSCNSGCKQFVQSSKEVISKQQRSSNEIEDRVHVQCSLDDDGSPVQLRTPVVNESNDEVFICPAWERLAEGKSKKGVSPLSSAFLRKAWIAPRIRRNVRQDFQNGTSSRLKGKTRTLNHEGFFPRPYKKKEKLKRASKLQKHNVDYQSIRDKDCD